MAKGQKRSTREAKKPKAAKKPQPVQTGAARGGGAVKPPAKEK